MNELEASALQTQCDVRWVKYETEMQNMWENTLLFTPWTKCKLNQLALKLTAQLKQFNS